MKPSSLKRSRRASPPIIYRVVFALMCPLMKLMGLSCRQFAELASARMDCPLTRWQSLRFRFHRAMCGLCRRLPNQLENLRVLTRHACEAEEEPPVDGVALSPEARQRLREALEAEERDAS